jgi:hypothetical protein
LRILERVLNQEQPFFSISSLFESNEWRHRVR